VTARSLQAVLRSLADAAPPVADGEFLRRFLQGDEAAFAELVRRHGRLVWAACRHLTGSDAEADDAFQATFLVLLKNAAKIRDVGRLSAWLHGVAYKVCAKARQAEKRRTTRERATAASERNGAAVPESAWDRAMAAVHEEAAKLPETLRVPFVLCCLEGRGVTEAAEQLGWKLGTFSGRLTRAKDALLARLDARGLTLAVVAGVGLATPPATAVAKAVALARVGSVVPGSILQLSQGVIGMSLKSFKVLAAAVLLTCGLGLGLGGGLVGTADAQATPQPDKLKEAEKQLQEKLEALRQAELEKAQRDADTAKLLDEAKRAEEVRRQRERAIERDRVATYEALMAEAIRDRNEAASAKTTKWEYDFVAVSEMTMTKFVEFLQDRESRGWEYNGLTKYRHDGKLADIWVFRRPAKGTATNSLLHEYSRKVSPNAGATETLRAGPPMTPDDAKTLEAEIARLQEKLAELKKAKGPAQRMVFPAKDLPLEAHELAEVLFKLAAKNLKNAKGSFTHTGGNLIVEGDKELIDWVAAMIKKLNEK
jgi:RNA polymerase sigma factor (sigma-70 family)